MTKKPLIALAVVVLAAAAVAAWHYGRPAAPSDRIVLYGNVDLRQVSLAFSGSERVAELAVRDCATRSARVRVA
ncbi:hypothetical protein ACEN8K_44780, partial [Variovorax sp. CT11-76]